MATLNWIGKEAVVNHDKEVPFKLLEKVPSASVGKESKNLIIHGDNLEALKALMPFYKGKVKCIYIDPPYNTGNEKWKFNDNVNSPKIREWIGKVVGAESEDLTRHDKWLCMMYPRLKLLKDLLTDDGVLFISIDENEIGNIILLAKEIFGDDSNDFLIWRKTGKQSNTKRIARVKTTHEYILVIYKNKGQISLSKIKLMPQWQNEYTNPDNDKRGIYKQGIISNKEEYSNPKSKNFYAITTPGGKVYSREWYISKKEFDYLLADNRIYFPKSGNGVPAKKIFQDEEQSYYLDSIIDRMGDFTSAREEIIELFGDKDIFTTPKPRKLIKELIRCASTSDSIILDSFSGSGTSGHAVLDLNKEDGGNRQFILVEMEDDVAKKITAERVKRAIKKFDYNDGFEYCELAKPLFNEKGQINEACSYDELASYIYFTETQTNIDKKSLKDPFIGESHGVSYFLIYAGKDKNDLTRETLLNLKVSGSAVIYADRCLVDEEELKAKGVVFKQIPYEIKVY